uniref:Uncharacterized protein n=1 Tax=Zosterops lateralis melanops TaxID=1220523 RepID=A0A8D2PMC1_ZOSLA
MLRLCKVPFHDKVHYTQWRYVCCKLVLKWFGNVQVMDLLCSFCRVPFEDPEDAVLVRAMTRSLMEFSSVDWNKVATCQERRLKDEAEEPLEKLTVQFR